MIEIQLNAIQERACGERMTYVHIDDVHASSCTKQNLERWLRIVCSTGQLVYVFISYLPSMDSGDVWLVRVSMPGTDLLGVERDPDPCCSLWLGCVVVGDAKSDTVVNA
jgi:hypothetical protein